MNADAESPERDAPGLSPVDAQPGTGGDWRYWMRRLLICNPFFLCSAALLLFAVNRLSTDDRLFQSDVHNLFFNFFSLQVYEIALVVTALLLARRFIWYDSALLVVLENGLVLVPFMLISQASLEGMSLAWTLAAVGGLMAAGRFGCLRHGYPEFNLPPRALALGVLILMFNVALPMIFRPTMELDVENWRVPNELIWMIVLPMVGAGASLLPRPVRYDGHQAGRHWLPLFVYGLWVLGSAVHAWCVAHISGLPLELYHLAPLACVATWSVHHRAADLVRCPSLRLRIGLLLLTAPAPMLAFGRGEMFVLLAGVNLLAYSALWMGCRELSEYRTVARQLALATLALLLAGLPNEWVHAVFPELSKSRATFAAAMFYVASLACFSRVPGMALCGAFATGFGISAVFQPDTSHVTMQAALAFLVVHSLGWNDESHSGARLLRFLALVIWVVESIASSRAVRVVDPASATAGITVIAFWSVARWGMGRPSSGIVPAVALAAMFSSPAGWCVHHGSVGLTALVASAALFAGGALIALNRPRWSTNPAASDE